MQSESKRQEKDENIRLLPFASISLQAKIIIEFDGGQVVFFTLPLDSFGRRRIGLTLLLTPLSLSCTMDSESDRFYDGRCAA